MIENFVGNSENEKGLISLWYFIRYAIFYHKITGEEKLPSYHTNPKFGTRY